jgi:hypothetical protein
MILHSKGFISLLETDNGKNRTPDTVTKKRRWEGGI